MYVTIKKDYLMFGKLVILWLELSECFRLEMYWFNMDAVQSTDTVSIQYYAIQINYYITLFIQLKLEMTFV